MIRMLALLAAALPLAAGQDTAFQLNLRSRKGDAPSVAAASWPAARTAVIVCDMWDKHTCKNATRRVAEMAPKLDAFLKIARAKGALIIHAPSETMKFYEGAPQRKRAQEAPAVKPPEPIQGRRLDLEREGPLPVDDSEWCDDEPQCHTGKPYPWTRQIDTIEIAEPDAVSDNGQEVFNLFKQRGIEHVLVTGVHTNMCVLGRSFAIRQLVRLGFKVALVRDLTDALYNPKKPPHVSHDRGTELIIEHIERHWCPSILSSDIAAPPVPFELNEGDRVAFIGNAFFEHDLRHNSLETLLTARFHDRNVTFRNLGWSGDTVWGHARACFGSTEDGFKQLKGHVADLKPTVLFLAYGLNESFDGEAGLANFQKGLDRLLDMLSESKARIVILSPLRHEDLGRPLPDPAEHNKSLALYVDLLKKTAERRGHRFVDLFTLETDKPFTDNGIHLTAHGYRRAADAIVNGLGLAPRRWNEERLEKLRATITAKNQLYFHRWRPQNNTYLFLFRKHEQGKNAVEPPKFDPLVAEKEKEIAAAAAEVAK